MTNLVLIIVIASLLVLGAFVVPVVLMHYEIPSGVPFVLSVVLLGLVVAHIMTRVERQSRKEEQRREHMKHSSLFKDTDY